MLTNNCFDISGNYNTSVETKTILEKQRCLYNQFEFVHNNNLVFDKN